MNAEHEVDQALATVGKLVEVPAKSDRAFYRVLLITFVLAVCIAIISSVVFVMARNDVAEITRSKEQQQVDDCRQALTARITAAADKRDNAKGHALSVILDVFLLVRTAQTEQINDQIIRDAQAQIDAATTAATAAVVARDAWDRAQRLPCPVNPTG